jgi:hypothetical protein
MPLSLLYQLNYLLLRQDQCQPSILTFWPVHWLSKRQTITAGSSAKAEIYATDECVKFLLELVQLLEFLEVKDIFMPTTSTIYNDNKACIQWSKSTTTKGLRHIQMKENCIRENIHSNFISFAHVDGKANIADIFTKEMKDVAHFVELRNLFMLPRPKLCTGELSNSLDNTQSFLNLFLLFLFSI